MLKTVDAVVDALGGTGAVARLTERKPQAISNWRTKGKLPPQTFLLLSRELESRGLSAAPELWSMETVRA